MTRQAATRSFPFGILIGVGIGIALGIALGSVAVGVGVGAGLAVLFGLALDRNKRDDS